ncbi:hypothetical protein SAMN05216567_112101 [Variovorax sp. OK605]|jgi:hypothetical protein|uniref:hypothetical protein n=1 Tax=Variovorax sp. OK605 TaxID=1855317 RepID=UPI0008E6EDF3|nr:hypothetical protein [Variovorax sp. OK605]SFQ22023.1 hypothetical protein SAMN05216567_112101 [Variovorax sp. OK605]
MPDSHSNRPSQLLAILPRQNIIQDDGVHVLVSTKDVEGARSDGMLLRRCDFSLSAPFGYVCLGHFKHLSENCWQASLGTLVLLDEGAERPDRLYATELDALVSLWASRRRLSLARV